MSSDDLIQNPKLSFGSGTAPRSDRFGDTYFDRENGLAESRHVFLDGCGLSDIWAKRRRFVIGELGFGTGLNFLAAWQLWQRMEHRPTTLHYVSIEGFPLSGSQVDKCLTPWPDLTPLRTELVTAYPDPHPGMHRIFFNNSQVILTLVFGPVLSALKSVEGNVDAWFLDGFAPSQNPDMWHLDVIEQVARLSNPGTRLATFSVAGDVRRNLNQAGFELEKRDGAGRKREVLAGIYRGGDSRSRLQPWYATPRGVDTPHPTVAVIGGGLAGAHVAHAFARRGCSVCIYERTDSVTREASSVPAPVMMPRLTVDDSVDGSFYAVAWRHAVQNMADQNIGWQPCGVIQLASSEDEAERLKRVWMTKPLPETSIQLLDATEVSDISGVALQREGLFFPEGGWIEAPALNRSLTGNTTIELGQAVTSVQRENDYWSLYVQDGKRVARADIVVLANSLGAVKFTQASHLPVTARQGQLSFLEETVNSKSLMCVLIGNGHVTPSIDGHHICGATFDHVDISSEGGQPARPSEEADQRNISRARTLAPGIFSQDTKIAKKGWSGLRCTTPDHLPIVGPLFNHQTYTNDYVDLHHGRHWVDYPAATYEPGFFMLGGLGSRGTVTAALCAELIASQALNEPLPVSQRHVEALHPGRFIIRSLKRPPA